MISKRANAVFSACTDILDHAISYIYVEDKKKGGKSVNGVPSNVLSNVDGPERTAQKTTVTTIAAMQKNDQQLLNDRQ